MPELIELADHLTHLAADPDSITADTVRFLAERVTEVLELCEAEAFDDDGAVDLARHMVVGTRPSPGPGRTDAIAATVRVGYTWRGLLVRPQEVIAYADTADDQGA
ncbi:hypothetical protein [Actinokineospora inagensis]|uniref:hypothetical protein n=1 Tax=Actinokineospora inagensis TaxID=103730 RepID=UPI00041CB910|nr:hypothetical protein [Actinokineospora inagensis]